MREGWRDITVQAARRAMLGSFSIWCIRNRIHYNIVPGEHILVCLWSRAKSGVCSALVEHADGSM